MQLCERCIVDAIFAEGWCWVCWISRFERGGDVVRFATPAVLPSLLPASIGIASHRSLLRCSSGSLSVAALAWRAMWSMARLRQAGDVVRLATKPAFSLFVRQYPQSFSSKRRAASCFSVVGRFLLMVGGVVDVRCVCRDPVDLRLLAVHGWGM
jgi:hypothetical protein